MSFQLSPSLFGHAITLHAMAVAVLWPCKLFIAGLNSELEQPQTSLVYRARYFKGFGHDQFFRQRSTRSVGNSC
jgi:hypothetical protein